MSDRRFVHDSPPAPLARSPFSKARCDSWAFEAMLWFSNVTAGRRRRKQRDSATFPAVPDIYVQVMH